MPTDARISDCWAYFMSEQVVFEKHEGLLWQPIYTLCRNEKKVYSLIEQEGLPAYLPMKSESPRYILLSARGVPTATNEISSFRCFRTISLPTSRLISNQCWWEKEKSFGCFQLMKQQKILFFTNLKLFKNLKRYPSQRNLISVSNSENSENRVEFVDRQLKWPKKSDIPRS